MELPYKRYHECTKNIESKLTYYLLFPAFIITIYLFVIYYVLVIFATKHPCFSTLDILMMIL